jgi:outer membrane lipoprotein SlyB
MKPISIRKGRRFPGCERPFKNKVRWWPLWGVMLLSGCASAPCRDLPAQGLGQATAPSVPSTQVYFYPQQGQNGEQQSRDHYECYQWAIDQTGFDPARSALPAEQRVRMVPMPSPGYDTATFAIAGAVLGALIGGPRHGAGGAVIGAVGGAMAGAVSDADRREASRQQEESYAAQDRARRARIENQSAGFRRAMCACLEGRGYSVR